MLVAKLAGMANDRLISGRNCLAQAIESSRELVHWDVIGQVNGSPDLNVAEFFDTPQTMQTFYRVVQ
jgi:hypothetical protein